MDMSAAEVVGLDHMFVVDMSVEGMVDVVS